MWTKINQNRIAKPLRLRQRYDGWQDQRHVLPPFHSAQRGRPGPFGIRGEPRKAKRSTIFQPMRQKIPQQKMEDSLPATTKRRFCFWWKIWWRKFSGEVFGWAPPWKPPHPRSCPQPEFPLPTLSIPLGVVVQLSVMHPWATTATGIALVRQLDFMCRWVDQTLNDGEILVIPM